MPARSFFVFCLFFYGSFSLATTDQEYREAIRTQEYKDNRQTAEQEFGSQGGIHLDGSGRTVHTNSQYYKDKAKRLGEDIEALDSQLAVKEARLNWLKNHCRPNKVEDCNTAPVEEAIKELKEQRVDLVAEKARAEHNQSITAQFKKTNEETRQAIEDARESAKKKAKKQQKLLYLTAGINAAAGAYLLKTKCLPNGPHYGCVLGPVALAQAGLTMKRAGEMGKTGDQFSGDIGLGSIDTPGCAQYPSLCDVNLPTTPGGPTTITGPCPNGMPGNADGECTFTINPPGPTDPPGPTGLCANGMPKNADGECTVTITGGPPDDETKFTFNDPNIPTVTVTPVGGGDPWTLPKPPEGSFSMNDPEIQSTLAGLKNKHAPLYKDAQALAEELGGSVAAGSSPLAALGGSGLGVGGSAVGGLGGEDASVGGLDSGGKFGKGKSSFAGGGSEEAIDDGDGSGRGKRGVASPYRNLLSQFNKKRKMSRDLVGEKAVTFGEDKIGVVEDNIFLMVHRAYEKHREDDEFIEEATRL